jgi:hypothetical protein
MKTCDLQVGHTYRGVDGSTAKVIAIFGRGRNRKVQIRPTRSLAWRFYLIVAFADWCQEDVTELNNRKVTHAIRSKDLRRTA